MNETRRNPTTGRQSHSLFDKWHGILYMPSRTGIPRVWAYQGLWLPSHTDMAGHTKAFAYPVTGITYWTVVKLATWLCAHTWIFAPEWRCVTLDSHLFCEHMNITPSIAPSIKRPYLIVYRCILESFCIAIINVSLSPENWDQLRADIATPGLAILSNTCPVGLLPHVTSTWTTQAFLAIYTQYSLVTLCSRDHLPVTTQSWHQCSRQWRNMAQNAGMYCVVNIFARFSSFFTTREHFTAVRSQCIYTPNKSEKHLPCTSKCVNSAEVSINLKNLVDSGKFYLVGYYL